MHISQLGIPTASATTGDGTQDGGQQAAKAKKSKLQLWNDLKISGMMMSCISPKSVVLTRL
jgi:peroxin-3